MHVDVRMGEPGAAEKHFSFCISQISDCCVFSITVDRESLPWYLLCHMGAICFCQKAAQHPVNVLPECGYQLFPQGSTLS